MLLFCVTGFMHLLQPHALYINAVCVIYFIGASVHKKRCGFFKNDFRWRFALVNAIFGIAYSMWRQFVIRRDFSEKMDMWRLTINLVQANCILSRSCVSLRLQSCNSGQCQMCSTYVLIEMNVKLVSRLQFASSKGLKALQVIMLFESTTH